MLEYRRYLKEPARLLRKQMTAAELLLWSRLRRKQLGVLFSRQKPLGPYIVDFYAFDAALVVEVDGSQHHEPEQAMRDVARDGFLAEAGLLVLRFDNLQVLQETEAVMEVISEAVKRRMMMMRRRRRKKTPLAPLYERGG